MRAPVTSFTKKFISLFFAATLVVGLVPAAAFAANDGLQSIPEGSKGAVSIASSAEGGDADVFSHCPSDESPAADGAGAATPSEDGSDANGGLTTATTSVNVINQTMPLTKPVAQQESTCSYFLAQTLESTKTVPIVSANLPLDKGTNQGPQAGADGGTTVGSEDKVTDGDPSVSIEGEAGSEPEGGDDSDESDLGVSDDASAVTPGVSSGSTVVGSFTYLGMTFAVEPDGESVALVAVDYSKLPEEFVREQILAVPDAATSDGVDYYTVSRITANAFADLKKETADPDYTGCIELFSDEELLAEAGIDPVEVQEFLNTEPIESESIEPSGEVRTIVSMDGNTATLDDGSTYTFANPLAGCAGILALGIPISVTNIEDDAFSGADTMQYVVVSEDNPEYASYDGALYSADLTNLRLIPEGRIGAVRVASSATSVGSEVFSRCLMLNTSLFDVDRKADEPVAPSYDSFLAIGEKTKDAVSFQEARLERVMRAGYLRLTHAMTSSYKTSTYTDHSEVRSAAFYSAVYTVPELLRVSMHYTQYATESKPFDRVDCSWVSCEASKKYNTATNVVDIGSGVTFWDCPAGLGLVFSSYPSCHNHSVTFDEMHFTTAAQLNAYLQGGYSVTWNGNGATSGVPSNLSQATSAIISTPSRTGYTFNGWAASGTVSGGTQNSSGYYTGGTVTIGSDVTFTAQWTRNTYTIGYTLNGGIVSGNPTSYNVDTAAFTLKNPTRSGYTFTGWSGTGLSGSTNKTVTVAKGSTGNRSYTANWTRDIYTISYTLNGGSVSGNPTSYNVDTAAFTLKNPTRTGYTFAGWSGTGLSSSANKTVTIAKGSTGNRSYTANWTKNSYNVSWNTNGGSVSSIAGSSVPYQNTFTVNQSPGTKTGHSFGGWSASGGVTGTYQNGSSFTMPASAVTLTAIWTKNSYGVSWNTNGGSVSSIATNSVPYQNTFTVNQNPGTKFGHDFSGWQASGGVTGTYRNGSSFTMPASAVTLTAVWTSHTHKVVFDAVGGSGGSSTIASQAFGASVAMRDPGTKVGYDFGGWKCSADGQTYAYPSSYTMGDADVTFTALWAPHLYTITYKVGSPAEGVAPALSYDDGWPMSKWTYAGSNTYTTTYTVEDGKVSLPVPFVKGYLFDIAGGNIPAHDPESEAVTSHSFMPGLGAGEAHADMVFEVSWMDIDYRISFENVGHAFLANDGSAHPRSIGFTEADIENGAVISVSVPAFDADYYTAFAGWKMERIGAGGAWEGIGTALLPVTLTKDNYKDYFGDGHDLRFTANWSLKEWSITVPKPDGVDPWPPADLGEPWVSNPATGEIERPYDCETEVALPNLTRYGYDHTGWMVAAYKEGVQQGQPYEAERRNGVSYIKADTVYDLVPAPIWVPKVSRVVFDLAADDASVADAATFPSSADKALSATFDAVMPTSNAAAGSAVQIPSRPDDAERTYTFLGFFDNKGRQFYDASVASVRAWDYEPILNENGTEIPHILYARWQDRDVDGDGEDDIPSKGTEADASVDKGSALSLRAQNVRYGNTASVIDGVYNGLLQWSSASAYPHADDAVRLSVSHIEYANGKTHVEAAKEIRSALEYDEGSTHYYVLGFEVLSTGDYLSFADIIYDNAFTLALSGADLERAATMSAPSLSIAADKVRVIYTDIDPGYGDGTDPGKNPGITPDPSDPDASALKQGDVVVTSFDAGAGVFQGGARIYNVTTKVEDPDAAYPRLPEPEPVRSGYVFSGWSSVPQAQHADEGCVEFKKGAGQVPRLTSKAHLTYYAHWVPREYAIAFDLNYEGATMNVGSVKASFGELPEDLPVAKAQAAAGVRGSDWVLVGWFDVLDAAGGAMLFDAAGHARTVWCDDVDDPRVYARWAYAGEGPGTDPDDPSKPTDPTDPDPADPFPGVPGITDVIPTTEDACAITFSALDGANDPQNVLLGTYDGIFRYRPKTESRIPDAASPVQVSVNAYAPEGGANRTEALKQVQREFEGSAPEGMPYLQGFRILSTGAFVSWADVWAGRSFSLDCLGSDLTWETPYEAPASVRIDAFKVEAVYGTTPCINPDDGSDWPIGKPDEELPDAPATQVVNVFDAGMGRFADGARFLNVKSEYEAVVTVPGEGTDLPLPGGELPSYNPEEGWHFAHWVDAWGTIVDDAYEQVTITTRTFYAVYAQTTHAIDFAVKDDAASVLNYESEDAVGPIEGTASSIRAYDGQKMNRLLWPEPRYGSTFWRDGYDLLGWFSEDGSTAYWLTDAGKAYRDANGGSLADRLVPPDATVTGPITAYALWAAKEYELVWHWNYPDYTVSDGTAFPGTAGTAADIRGTDTVRFGQRFDVPAVDDGRFAFDRWYKVASDPDPVADAIGADIHKVAGHDGTCFVPGHDASLGSELHYYAFWKNIDRGPSRYTVFVHPGAHAAAGAAVIERLYDFTHEVVLAEEGRWAPEAGYVFSHFVEADETGAPVSEEVTETVPRGSTGDKHYVAVWQPAEYALRLIGLDGVGMWDAPAGWTAPVRSFKLGDAAIEFPSKEWMEENIEKPGHAFMGWSPTGSAEDIASSFDPDAHILTHPDVKEVAYTAVWEAVAYTVAFDPGTGNDVDIAIVFASYEEAKPFKVPSPVVRGASGVFSHWGTTNGDRFNRWMPEEGLTVKDILEEGQYPERRVEAVKEIAGVAYTNVITLHAVWAKPLSVDVPLHVNIAIDPETGDTMAADGWLRTSYDDDVRVESLAYGKTASSSSGGGTDAVLGSALDRATLTVRALRSDAEGAADEAFASMAPYEVLLAADSIASRSEIADAFPFFGSNGTYLNIRYDLAFGNGFDTRTLASTLPAKNVDGTSSQSFPIANLYYTLGLA